MRDNQFFCHKKVITDGKVISILLSKPKIEKKKINVEDYQVLWEINPGTVYPPGLFFKIDWPHHHIFRKENNFTIK